MKLSELVNSVEALQRLGQTKMAAKVAYAVAKNLRMIDAELEVFNETRSGLLERYRTLNEETKAYEIKDQAGLDREYKELLGTETGFTPLRIRLDTLGEVDVTPSDMATLMWLIIEDDNAGTKT